MEAFSPKNQETSDKPKRPDQAPPGHEEQGQMDLRWDPGQLEKWVKSRDSLEFS